MLRTGDCSSQSSISPRGSGRLTGIPVCRFNKALAAVWVWTTVVVYCQEMKHMEIQLRPVELPDPQPVTAIRLVEL
jgi:hypothetical protein